MQVKKEHLLPVEDRIITEKLKYDVLCGICCMILTHPRQCLSGHVYCGDCLAKCIGKGMPCPVCRRDMTEESVARNLFLEEYCKEFLVHCQYYYECPETENPILVIADDGCPEEIQYCDLESHEKECKYSWIRCPFTYRSNSEHKVRKLNWQAHKEVCEFRPTICRYCDNCQPFMELNDHEQSCPKRPVTCDNCGENLLQKDLQSHKKTVCELESINCPFYKHGCKTNFERKELANHCSKEVQNHLILLQSSHDKALIEQQNSFKSTLDSMQNAIMNLQSQIQNKCETTFSTTWTVSNFTNIKERCYKRSNSFTFFDWEWFIGAYFFGDTDDSKEYLSIYLFSQSTPKNRRITLKYSLIIMNHVDEDLSVTKEFNVTFPVTSGQGWGDRKAVTHQQILKEKGFLKNNSLTIHCKIHVIDVHWDLQER